MNSPADNLPDSAVEELLEQMLEQLAAAGPLEDLGSLWSFLPEVDEETRKFLAIELIKLDMALHVEAGTVRLIDDYLAAGNGLLLLDHVPLDLVLEEIQLRQALGQEATYEEYERRFPWLSGMLQHLPRLYRTTLVDSPMERPPTFPLQTQVDDFLLLEQLGQGAFATVYLARQLSMQRLVAVKISQRIGQESRSLARFDHPNIVRVYDQRSTEDGRLHLLYMQFVPGGTLADVVRRVRESTGAVSGMTLLESVDKNLLQTSQGTPENSECRNWLATADWPTTVAWLGIQLASALQSAHDVQVLHRDIKPANVLLTAEGIPKLADFNVSLLSGVDDAQTAQALGGSIAYMAPEHLRAISSRSLVSEKVAEPADIFSLAVMLWELWQGHRPFYPQAAAKDWRQGVANQRAAVLEPPRLSRHPGRHVATSELILEQALRSALAVDPANRPANAASLAGQLRLALHPEAAKLFQVQLDAVRSRVLSTPTWLVAMLVILIPNALGGFLNYQYNYHQVMSLEMRQGLQSLSWYVNLFFFPVGALCILFFSTAVVKAQRAASRGRTVHADDVGGTLELGNRAGVIGGTMWLLSGIVFPMGLWWMDLAPTWQQITHLLISALVCGGIAMAYPFFGMALIATWVYYPHFIATTLRDPKFEARRGRMISQSEVYLLVAALVPLLGASLLVTKQSDSTRFLLIAIAAGALGSLVATLTHRVVSRGWGIMNQLLSNQTMPLIRRDV